MSSNKVLLPKIRAQTPTRFKRLLFEVLREIVTWNAEGMNRGVIRIVIDPKSNPIKFVTEFKESNADPTASVLRLFAYAMSNNPTKWERDFVKRIMDTTDNPDHMALMSIKREFDARVVARDKFFGPFFPENAQLFEEPNVFMSRKLKEVAELRTRERDAKSARAHRKASDIIARQPNNIVTYFDAIKIKGIGQSIAGKIEELANTGTLEILESRSPVDEIIELFTSIWGVGPATARLWYDRGFRTISDIEAAAVTEDIILTKQQAIGLRHYVDFAKPISHTTMTAIGDLIQKLFNEIGEGFKVEIVGSYRRGKQSSKDVDMIIYSHNEQSSEDWDRARSKIIEKLSASSLELLASGRRELQGGICFEGVFRRIDLFYVLNANELGCALVAHTGPAALNKRMRGIALSKGWCLNEYCLKNLDNGQVFDTPDEQNVFTLLDLEYQEPRNRK